MPFKFNPFTASFDLVDSNELQSASNVWVDPVYGNDATGLVERIDKPFSTINAAWTAMGTHPRRNNCVFNLKQGTHTLTDRLSDATWGNTFGSARRITFICEGEASQTVINYPVTVADNGEIIQLSTNSTHFLTIIGGYLLSFLWWASRWNAMWGVKLEGRLGQEGAQVAQKGGINLISKIITSIPKIFPSHGGTATRVYTFNDFFIAKSQNMINNPIGIGIIICILTIVSLIYIILKFKSLSEKKIASIQKFALKKKKDNMDNILERVGQIRLLNLVVEGAELKSLF